jgi:hypothetical protein
MPHGLLREPDRQASPPYKSGIILWPVRHPISALVKLVTAASGYRFPELRRRDDWAILPSGHHETALARRLVFHRSLRQTEGLKRSIADVLEIAIAIPDHTTMSRRGSGLALPKTVGREEPLHLLVDSPGFQHGQKARSAQI